MEEKLRFKRNVAWAMEQCTEAVDSLHALAGGQGAYMEQFRRDRCNNLVRLGRVCREMSERGELGRERPGSSLHCMLLRHVRARVSKALRRVTRTSTATPRPHSAS